MNEATKEELAQMERGFWEAAGAKSDFYEDHLAAWALFLLPIGILDRSSVVASTGEAAPWDDYHMSDLSLVEPADETKILIYEATGRRGDDEYCALVSSTYITEAGEWRLLVHQQTPLS